MKIGPISGNGIGRNAIVEWEDSCYKIKRCAIKYCIVLCRYFARELEWRFGLMQNPTDAKEWWMDAERTQLSVNEFCVMWMYGRSYWIGRGKFLYGDYMKRRGMGEMVVSSSRWEMATEREPAGDVFWWQRNREVRNREYGTYLKFRLQEEYWIETAGVVMFTGRSNDIDYTGYRFGYIFGNGTHDSSHALVGTDFWTVLYGNGICCWRIGEESKSRVIVGKMKDSGMKIQRNGGRMVGFVYRHACISVNWDRTVVKDHFLEII